MRKIFKKLLVWICVFCFMQGCRSSLGNTPVGTTAPSTKQPTSGSVTLGQTGKVRVTYRGNSSSVQYITSVEQLPDNEALAAYDEAYFREKALLLVTESVSSGSIKVEIKGIHVAGTVASVELSHDLPGDAGTADMATWLLWAEVDKDLNYQWKVANPALPPDTQIS